VQVGRQLGRRRPGESDTEVTWNIEADRARYLAIVQAGTGKGQ
jgi:hypothetical protein